MAPSVRMAPLRRTRRALRIWRTVLTLIALLWWDGQAWTYRGGLSSERRQERQRQRAKWLTAELLTLGSAFIKLGQLLSARPDVLPAGWVAELAELQDRVPAFSFDRVQSVLEEELGQRCAEVVDLDGPLWLAEDWDNALRYDGTVVHPSTPALWGILLR